MSFYIELPPIELPGPRPLPLLGARGNLLRFLGDPVQTMLRLHGRYGDVVPLTRHDPAWVLAFGAANNHAVLSDTGKFHNFADHPVSVPPGSAAAKFALSLVSQNGDVHRRARRAMMPAFAKSRLDRYAAKIAATAAPTLDRLAPGEVLDFNAVTVELSLGVALRCLLDVDLRHERDLGELVLDYLSRVFSPANMILPVELPGTPYTRFVAVAERLGARVEALLAERRRRGPGDDVLSALIEAYTDDEDGREQEAIDDELLGQTALLVIAGHETTAHTLAWTLLLLSQHPAVQDALGREIAAAGLGDAPEFDEILALPLLDRVVKESMRLLPAVPMLFFRRSTEPFCFGDHELPIGTTIVLSPLVTHRDPTVFPAPRRFDPDRWLTSTPGPYEYMPFGAGARRCLGAIFAERVVRLLLVMLLRRFRVAMAEGARVSYRTGGVTMGPKRLCVRLFDRDETPPLVRVRGNVHELVELSA